MAEHKPHLAEIESNASTPSSSSPHKNGAQSRKSSNGAHPPPYTKNTALDDPFRDEVPPRGNFSSDSDDTQKALMPAAAIDMDHPPATTPTTVVTPPPMPSAAADPFAVEVDSSLLSPPPPSSRPPGLRRGLQIPSRVSHITWGFSFPKVLAEHGVTKPVWRKFKHEVKAFASMSFTQHVTVIACHVGLDHFLGPGPGQYPNILMPLSILLTSGQL